MPPKYFFDTGFLTLALNGKLPEKWHRPWNEIKEHIKKAYITEPVIAEIYYKLMTASNKTKETAKNMIMELKSIGSIEIWDLEDNDSFKAGLFNRRFNDLSYTDCFTLAISQRSKLTLFTTDDGLKRAAQDVQVRCDYLPFESIKN